MAERTMFDDFVDKMEVVYAVLLAWGFARVAEFYVTDINYILAGIVSGFVLIRFFFAASHNLKPVASKSKGSPLQQRLLFFFDIPMLILHSFIYYRMNFLLSKLDFIGFYAYLNWLLFLNTIWLVIINLRIKAYEKKSLYWCSKWTVNNLIFMVAIFIFLPVGNYYLLFLLAFANCVFDFVCTAPYYLGFNNE